MCCRCWLRVAEVNSSVPLNNTNYDQGGGSNMKKIAIELLIVAATVMAYVLPVLAEGGGS